MIERARQIQAEQGLKNLTFQVGPASPLPFGDGSFSIAVTRYSLHHLLDPLSALKEMRRVTRPGGRVVVCDAVVPDDPAKADGYNRMEKLRDPSHVRALPIAELRGLFRDAGLPEPEARFYAFEVEMEGLLKASFPKPGDEKQLREMILASIEDDALGMRTRRDGAEVKLSYPIVALAAERD
jgi:SAM-dependent methyltransferase